MTGILTRQISREKSHQTSSRSPNFISKLKPKLEEKVGLLLKKPKWSVRLYEVTGGFRCLIAERVGIVVVVIFVSVTV